MEHNPPTSGDFAMSQLTTERQISAALQKRVDELERQIEEIHEWADGITAGLNSVADYIERFSGHSFS